MIAAIYLSASFVAEATAAPQCDFVRQRALEATIVGTAGDDVIRGTERNDVIAARGGSSGHDRICAGKGADRVFGGVGRDALNGGRSADRIYGGEGSDAIDDGPGADVVLGGLKPR